MVYEGALFPGVGGGPKHYSGLSRALIRAGVDVVNVLPRGSEVTVAESRSHHYLSAPGSRVGRHLAYEVSRIQLLLSWWVRGRRVDVWLSRHSLFGVGLVLARLVARTVVLEVNGPVREELVSNFGSKWLARFADLLFRLQVRSAHLTVAVTPGLAEYVVARYSAARCAVLPNGADPTSGSPTPLGERDLDLLFVGAITPWYELDVVLDALHRLRSEGTEIQILVLGDGQGLAHLQDKVRSLGISDLVTFAGWVESERVNEEMRRARVGLLPLRPKSIGVRAVGSPLKLYEYLAAGLRVVGTNIDGIENAPVNCAVEAYEQGSVESCARALTRALGNANDEVIEARLWSWDARARELLTLLATGTAPGGR